MQVRKIRAGAFEFDCRVSGTEGNETVLLLHGFPETSHMWIPLMEKLSAMGYYCVAPNMRGYSESACPKGIKKYTTEHLKQDILNLADVVQAHTFHLIAHDWGAIIGWHLAYHHPDRIRTWTALSVPHLKGFAKALKTDPVQKKKSRYIGWFLVPILPEMMLRKKDFAKFRRLWKHSSPEELHDYLTVFRRKKTLTAALNYYRANLGKRRPPPIGDISTPTLFIWGNRDLAIGKTAAENNHKYMKGAYTYLEVDGGHWLMQTNYADVERAVIKHLSS